ncbi:MAG TPA: AzlC family ABC transporter permease [Ilumatobacteraceae bacterium]
MQTDIDPATTAISVASTPRDAALAGARAIAPLATGLIPLALTVGAAAARAGLPPLVGWASSATLYGASGQLTWIQMTHSGAPAALVVGATLLVNMQMLLYGAAMRMYWSNTSRRWRVAAGFLLVSPVFAVATDRFRTEHDPVRRRRFYLAAGLTLWTTWLAVTGIGYAFGGLPSLPVLALLSPLVILSLALRAVRDSATLAALIVASTLAIFGRSTPYDVGTVAAGVIGIATGLVISRVARTDAPHARNAEP